MEAFSESRSDVSESPTESVTWQLDWCDFGFHWVCTHLIGLKTNLTLNPPSDMGFDQSITNASSFRVFQFVKIVNCVLSVSTLPPMVSAILMMAESLPQLTTITKINLAQKRSFWDLCLEAMHWCGNALTAAQEIESAHVPFSMLGN